MPAQDKQPAHLMVSGRYETIEIHRGMRVIDEAGQEVGFVAGVVVGEGDEKLTHLLVGRLPLTGDYRLAPVGIVTAVNSDRICLCLELVAWDALPQHEPQLK